MQGDALAIGNLGRLYVRGDILLLNKVDLVDAETVARVHQWIDGIRPGVQVFDTAQCRVPMEILLGVDATDPDREGSSAALGVHVHDVTTAGHDGHDHEHHHDLLFDTWAFTSSTPLRLGRMQQVLSHLPATVFRVKGFVHCVEEPQNRLVLQMVGRRTTVSLTPYKDDEARITRLVFIARHGTCNFEVLGKALGACLDDVAEQMSTEEGGRVSPDPQA